MNENKIRHARLAADLYIPRNFVKAWQPFFELAPPCFLIPSMSLPPKDSDAQLEFEELGLAQDPPPVPSLFGVPLKYIS